MKLKYDGLTKSYVSTNTKDVIMPSDEKKTYIRDIGFINGAPCGPFNPNKSYWPRGRKKEVAISGKKSLRDAS